jgi:hypothetical protein
MSLRVRSLCWRAGALAVVSWFSACAAAPVPHPAYRPSFTPAEEAAAIEAAKRHPIAQPSLRSRYPEQAPPPLAAPGGSSSPPPPPAYSGPPSGSYPGYPDARAASAPGPSDYEMDSPGYAAPGYGASPGYWAWSGSGYHWIVGDVLLSGPGYNYYGRPWGWAGRGPGLGIESYRGYRYPPRDYSTERWPGRYDTRRFAAPTRGYAVPSAGYRPEGRSAPAAPSHNGSAAIRVAPGGGHSSRAIIRRR